LRFLFLTQYYSPEIGAAPTRLQNVVEQLIQLGHEVEVVTARANYPHGRFVDGQGHKLYVRERRHGVFVHRVWIYPAIGGGFRRLANYASFAITSLLGLFRATKPDYIFVESPPLTTFFPALIAKSIWSVPYIFNVSDLWPDAAVENGFLTVGSFFRILLMLEAWTYRKASYVNAVTEGIQKKLLFDKNVSAEKVLFLPNGVDAARYQWREPDLELKKRLGLEGKEVILWAGTIGHAHGLENVLLAAKHLERHSRIHFLFLGDGSSRPQLEQMKMALDLDNVTFQDPVPMEDLPPFYSIARCGLASLKPLPSHDGARPSKIFSVLASGKPLIFVGRGECARLIESARAGIVVPPGKPDLLAAEIVRLMSDSTAIRQLGENGRRYVIANFQWSTIVSEWLNSLPRASGTVATGRVS
jgi:colanic acid biosynthesis glycosyl transferase WcaI